MTAEAVKDLYLCGKSLIFAKRNVDKTINGDPVRGLVAIAQVNNGVNAMSNWQNTVGRTAESYVNIVDRVAAPWEKGSGKVAEGAALTAGAGVGAAAGKKTAVGLAAYGLKIASKWVNPLIVISGGVKVARADDKKTETINQACAIGGMFAGEKTAYRLLTPEGRALIKDTKIAQKGLLKSILKTMEKIDKYAAASKSSKFGKIGIPLLKASAFVCASVGSYAIGAEIADQINDARGVHVLAKNSTSIQTAPENKDLLTEDTGNNSLEYIS